MIPKLLHKPVRLSPTFSIMIRHIINLFLARHYCYAYGQAIVDVRRQYLVKKNVCDSTEDKVWNVFLWQQNKIHIFADLVQRGALLWWAHLHPEPKWHVWGWRSPPGDRPRRSNSAQLSSPSRWTVLWDTGWGTNGHFYPNVHSWQLVQWDLLVYIHLAPYILACISFKYNIVSWNF